MIRIMLAINHGGHAGFGVRILPIIEEFYNSQKSAVDRLVTLYRINSALGKIVSIADYIEIADKESVDDMLIALDDFIDDLEAKASSAGFAEAFLLRRILSKMLTLQFLLSNRSADMIGEDQI